MNDKYRAGLTSAAVSDLIRDGLVGICAASAMPASSRSSTPTSSGARADRECSRIGPGASSVCISSKSGSCRLHPNIASDDDTNKAQTSEKKAASSFAVATVALGLQVWLGCILFKCRLQEDGQG
jgi:hypothetical protein